jgi:membrane protein DedA with SNARE-associated domain
MLESLIARWGYLAICCGTFLEGETVLVTAGTLCHEGLLFTPWAAAAGCAGSIAWSQVWFWTGRRLGVSGLARKRPHLVANLDPSLNRYGDLFVFGFRFVAGMGTVAPALIGALRYSAPRFAIVDSAGAALWTSAFGGIGWAIAAGVHGLTDKASHVSTLIALAFGISGLALLTLHWLRRRSSAD